MKDSKTYLIDIHYNSGGKKQIKLTTDRLNWSMEQYKRNRDFLTWRVIQ